MSDESIAPDATPGKPAARRMRPRRRVVLMVLIPLLGIALLLAFYLRGGIPLPGSKPTSPKPI
ncbi:MAG TPA: hypothetical protein VIM34_03445 [Burkholderiaceae bacterium]